MSDDRVDVEPAALVLSAIAELRGVKPDAWTEGPLFDLSIRLDRIEALIALLQEISGWLEVVLIDSMETDDVTVMGVGVLHREKKKRESWRYKHSADQLRNDLAAAVAADVSMDVGTGELDPIKRNIALATMRAAYEAIPSFSSVKVPGRIRFGIDLEDYRASEEYYSVKIERADDEAHR